MHHFKMKPLAAGEVPEGAVASILPVALRPKHPAKKLLDFYTRDEIDAAIEALIAALDGWDGDPDEELCGDETDGDFAEDEPCAKFAFYSNGPGCKISDPDEGVDDKGEEIGAEDSFHLSWAARQSSSPGCPIADPDYSPRH